MFVRAVRAGEAKLRGRARGTSPVAEARPDQMSLHRVRGGTRCPAGVPWCPAVSRRCPDDGVDDDDGDDDDVDESDDDDDHDVGDGDGDGDGDDDGDW